MQYREEGSNDSKCPGSEELDLILVIYLARVSHLPREMGRSRPVTVMFPSARRYMYMAAFASYSTASVILPGRNGDGDFSDTENGRTIELVVRVEGLGKLTFLGLQIKARVNVC